MTLWTRDVERHRQRGLIWDMFVVTRRRAKDKQERKPVMSLASSLHKAGLVCLFQKLLGERHESGVFQQTPSLCHLSRQRLASLLPRRLQSLGERSVTFGQRGRQIPDALSQLLPGRHAVHLAISNTDGQVQISANLASS